MNRLRLCAALAMMAAIVPAHASSIIAYTDPGGSGNQAWGGNLALDFTVNSAITVSAMGVFNAAGAGLIAGTLQVAIFNTGTNTQVTPTVTFHGAYTPTGFDVFQSITPVTLGPGNYLVDAVGFSASDLNGNLNLGGSGPALNTGGGLLSFTGAGWDSNSTLDEPLTCAICKAAPSPQNRQFDAGTFQFSALSSVPEPGTAGLILCGMALAAALRRRHARTKFTGAH